MNTSRKIIKSLTITLDTENRCFTVEGSDEFLQPEFLHTLNKEIAPKFFPELKEIEWNFYRKQNGILRVSEDQLIGSLMWFE